MTDSSLEESESGWMSITIGSGPPASKIPNSPSDLVSNASSDSSSKSHPACAR
ncbi:hypothetical protein NEOLEDRAFT_639735 [Neolentinus lepideus HHB14362 ss-1]|uniref:Uncharacterized protein n=1 Tax=Neolentinus lepideus HHB14362 ss-1 TaxID=1314782 RepID=A0A165QK94_9AGAM|nr:hypothetical protein NEOLEDRAFT_639735 [Neolentinus lepideus HHB14362 ss-1]